MTSTPSLAPEDRITEPVFETRWWVLLGRRVTDRLHEWTPRRTPRPMHLVDSVTGDHIVIRHGPRFTVFTVSGRDYYFSRDGIFDGTGAWSCCDEYHNKPPRLRVVS